jgi:hypothetical protein
MPMIDQPPESRFARLLKPFFDSIDPVLTFAIAMHQVDVYADLREAFTP